MSTPPDERLRTEFNDWARAGKGESMERGHRPVGEQAIALMNLPVNARVLDPRESSLQFPNIEFQVASAEKLPFADGEFSHAFSMESLYYYADIPQALREIARVLNTGGHFSCVVDLYEESKPSHQWIEQLKVPVQLLSTAQYRSLFKEAGG
jgi:ubiquinone/menaquinone biosynthesis C-methylase UbiE